MKKFHYIVACCIIVALALSITLAVNSCDLTESEKLEQNINTHEKELEKIRSKRDSANATPIPFSDIERQRIIDSINHRHGFNLSLRPA